MTGWGAVPAAFRPSYHPILPSAALPQGTPVRQLTARCPAAVCEAGPGDRPVAVAARLLPPPPPTVAVSLPDRSSDSLFVSQATFRPALSPLPLVLQFPSSIEGIVISVPFPFHFLSVLPLPVPIPAPTRPPSSPFLCRVRPFQHRIIISVLFYFFYSTRPSSLSPPSSRPHSAEPLSPTAVPASSRAAPMNAPARPGPTR